MTCGHDVTCRRSSAASRSSTRTSTPRRRRPPPERRDRPLACRTPSTPRPTPHLHFSYVLYRRSQPNSSCSCSSRSGGSPRPRACCPIVRYRRFCSAVLYRRGRGEPHAAAHQRRGPRSAPFRLWQCVMYLHYLRTSVCVME